MLKLWNLDKIVKFGQNCDSWLKLRNLDEIETFGQYCEIWLKLWYLSNWWIWMKFWSKLWYLAEFVKFGWYCEIWLKFWNMVQILKFGWNFEIWSKFWNLVKILKFGQNSEFFCLQILYLKIFHLKILNWICRQCVDCQVRNIDSDCLLLEKSTVTLASRLSTYWRPPSLYERYFDGQTFSENHIRSNVKCQWKEPQTLPSIKRTTEFQRGVEYSVWLSPINVSSLLWKRVSQSTDLLPSVEEVLNKVWPSVANICNQVQILNFRIIVVQKNVRPCLW